MPARAQLKLSTGVFLFILGTLCIALLAIFFVSLSWQATDAILAIEENDPLFDFPGLSSEELQEAAGIIRDANQEFLATLPGEFQLQQFYPYTFFEALVEVAETRTAFRRYPSWINAFWLLNAESRTTGAYLQDIKRFGQLWQTAKSAGNAQSASWVFMFLPGRATDIATYETNLALLEENAAELGHDLRLRYRCLVLFLCRGSEALFQPVASSQELNGPSFLSETEARVLPADVLTAYQLGLGAAADDSRLWSARTECFGNEDNTNFFFLWELSGNGNRNIFLPKLATNSFFQKINSAQLLPQDLKSYRAGFGYSRQMETHWYMCPDLGYYPELATMQALVKKIENEPFSKNLKAILPEIAEVLWEQERAIRNVGRVEPAMVASYLDTLRLAEMALGDTAPGLRSEIRNARAIWKTKTGNFIAVIRGLRRDATLHLSVINEVRDRKMTLLPTLVTRSHHSLLFATWNSSVWRLAVTPRFSFVYQKPYPRLRDFWSLRSELGEEAILRISGL